jgi:hypothetical protein
VCRRQNTYRRVCRCRFVCHDVCHPEDHVSLNNIENIYLNPKSSHRLETRLVFGPVTLIPVIPSPKREEVNTIQCFESSGV